MPIHTARLWSAHKSNISGFKIFLRLRFLLLPNQARCEPLALGSLSSLLPLLPWIVHWALKTLKDGKIVDQSARQTTTDCSSPCLCLPTLFPYMRTVANDVGDKPCREVFCWVCLGSGIVSERSGNNESDQANNRGVRSGTGRRIGIISHCQNSPAPNHL